MILVRILSTENVRRDIWVKH